MNFGASKSGVKLKDLIRSVRNCKTQQEERTVMAKESAFLRDAAKLQHSNYKHRNVAKLIYIHMMGYPTHFGQMECLKLIASPGFPEKRIGYLGLMILLDERQEVLMLVTNSLKTDLQSKDHFVVGLALTALANIGSTEMARDLAPEVESLLSSREPYIRKKAALCCLRMLRKAPELVEQLRLRTLPNANLLSDRSHAVLLAAITLHLHICEADPDAIAEYRKYVKKLCTLMTQLGRHSADYDANGINDPFLQVKILRLLRFLGKNCPEAADQMVDCLTQVASRTEHTKYSGNAVLYETVLTIMAIPCSSGLRSLAVNIMGKFLVQSDNNIRYVALSTLAKAVVIDTQAVQRHRQTVVECVRDMDVSIRRRALDLVYALVNESNIRTLAAELLDYLAVCDVTDFKPDLTNKICQLIVRHSPDRRWHIESLFQVLVQAGQHVKEEVCRALVVLIGNTPELQAFTSRLALRTLQQHRNSSADSLITVCCWCIGELGHLLVAPVERWEEGEPHVQVTEAAVVDIIAHVLEWPDVSNIGKEYALTAAVKLSARLPNQTPKLRSLISKFQRSLSLEVQQRSCEYSRLFGFDALRPALLECVPALDESSYTGNLRRSDVVEKAAEAQAAAAESPAGDDLSSLIDLVASRDTPAAAAGASQPAAAHTATPQPGFSGLDDLLGSLDAAPAIPTPAADAGGNLMDLLGAAAPAPAPVPAAAVPPVVPPGAAADPLADLLAGPGAAMPAVSLPIAAPAAQFPPITAFEKAPLLVRFSFAKDSVDATTTHITVQVTNTGATPLEGFVLKVAVPKYMTMRLEPASGSVVPPQGSGSVQQLIHITNGQHGVKALAMRLQLQYQLAGQQVLEQAQVKSFPPGL